MGIEIRNEDDGSGSEDETRDPIPKCPVSGSSVNQTHKPVGFAECSQKFPRGDLCFFLTSEETKYLTPSRVYSQGSAEILTAQQE